jgi:hypothetical protein
MSLNLNAFVNITWNTILRAFKQDIINDMMGEVSSIAQVSDKLQSNS